MSVTFGLGKSRHIYHILLYMSMCIFVYFFYINNTTKGSTSLMLIKLLHMKIGLNLVTHILCNVDLRDIPLFIIGKF